MEVLKCIVQILPMHTLPSTPVLFTYLYLSLLFPSLIELHFFGFPEPNFSHFKLSPPRLKRSFGGAFKCWLKIPPHHVHETEAGIGPPRGVNSAVLGFSIPLTVRERGQKIQGGKFTGTGTNCCADGDKNRATETAAFCVAFANQSEIFFFSSFL